VSRVRLHEAGLPAPEPQHEIYGEDGRFVARVDFCWKEKRTIGEFDGKIKYGRSLKPGQSIEDVLFKEKRREDALRDLGWQIVRWLWADLYRPGVIRDRVLRAFARAY
jgi:very-short-patch-repair endonuclease